MQRIYHTWDKWECYPAGFYESTPPKGMTPDEALTAYRDFLADVPRFKHAMERVVSEWPNSCEHYLSNENMNRVAWLGQAAMCIETRVPAVYRSGYNLLTEQQKQEADQAALECLNGWLAERGGEWLSLETVASKTVANLY
jgi:hypothetical protein